MPFGTAQVRAFGHSSRSTPSSYFFSSELSPSRRDSAQNRLTGSSYSTWKTALPAFTNGVSSPHSSYCAHCSLTAKSKSGSSSGICPRSFFRPTASPWRWAIRAMSRL